MIIENFKPFNGQHCETTTTGSLLKHLGVEYSEPMLFGLGEGLGFIFWNMKTMDFPFMGGRIKQDTLTENIARNLNLKLEVQETASIKKAWENVKICIDSKIPVGLKLDCYYLDYFTTKFHFAGHYVAMYGYDNDFAYVADAALQGCGKTSLKSIELARNEKGPMSSKNLSYTIQSNGKSNNLKATIFKTIKNNANDYLNPPITNIGYKGILKASKEIIKWFENSKNIENEFSTSAMLMEEAGTGGALFRNLYRDFLKESAELTENEILQNAYTLFVEIANYWNQVSGLFEETSKTKDIRHIEKASKLLVEISHKEKAAMELLLTI